jgi:hypothetical protein
MAKAKKGQTKPEKNKENQAKDQKRIQENQSILSKLKAWLKSKL